jgi:hypothetical protein
VRAARNIPEAAAGSRYVTWGHSQGGHSSIWTGHLGEQYAPELELLGVSAAAPALNLPDIMGAQWDTTVGWVIGPDVVESWPVHYPDLPLNGVISTPASKTWPFRVDECIKQATLEGLALETAGQRFFDINPQDDPAWAAAVQEQTPAPLPPGMPVFIAQGTDDEVVLPWPNAIVEQEWCDAGSDISVLWMGGITHMKAAVTAGPSAVEWIADRFAGRPAPRTCDVPPAVPPTDPDAGSSQS